MTKVENYLATPMPFPTQSPALPANVYVPLTTILVMLYGVIYLLALIQLGLIWYHKHKRFSYQTSLLFLILVWSSIRITLFSFYFKNAQEANKLIFFLYFMLYCLPIVLQFCTFCVLVLYYGQAYFKIANRNKRRKYSLILRSLILVSVFLFFTTSLVSAYFTREWQTNASKSNQLFKITLIRISITGFLFVLFGFIHSTFLFKLAKISMQYMIPEQNNISPLKALLVSTLTSFLLISRTLCNILAISVVNLKLPDFNFDWINVSDQADLVNLTDTNKFISFFCVLSIWELIPTFVIVYLFRLRLNRTKSLSLNASSLFASKSVFIDSKARDLNDESNSFENYLYNDQRRLLNKSDLNSSENFNESRQYYSSINAF